MSFVVAVVTIAASAAASTKHIGSVVLARPFFNPTLRETVALTITVMSPGALSAAIVDRDGVVVRRLPAQKIAGASEVVLKWDGRDDQNRTVPDEAYSFKIDFRSADGTTETYFPADEPQQMIALKADSYDRRDGVLRYRLPAASRVHIQAGLAELEPMTGASHGPVLKTIVNRAPRAAGSVIEYWSGFDESGTINVGSFRVRK